MGVSARGQRALHSFSGGRAHGPVPTTNGEGRVRAQDANLRHVFSEESLMAWSHTARMKMDSLGEVAQADNLRYPLFSRER